MADLTTIYSEINYSGRGSKIKIIDRTPDFVSLLNRKLGKNLIFISTKNSKNGTIYCKDARLKSVSWATSNRKVDKALSVAHKYFVELQKRKAWGLTSSFLKSIKFSRLADIYYANFKPDRVPNISQKDWVKYMTKEQFTPSKNICSLYDKYWSEYLTANEVAVWASNMDKKTPSLQLYEKETKPWVQDILPYVDKLPNALKGRNQNTLFFGELGIWANIIIFPCVIDLKPVMEATAIKNKNLSKVELDIIEFKFAQFLKRICEFLSKLITENLPLEYKKLPDVEMFQLRIKNVIEKYLDPYTHFIIKDISRYNFKAKLYVGEKKSLNISSIGNKFFVKCGKEICETTSDWLDKIKYSTLNDNAKS